MATNFVLPFAQGAGANVLSDADYATSDVIAQGFQQGRAASKKYNKAFRQSTAVASGFGQFTADFSGLDFTDGLSPMAMRDNFRLALAAAMDGVRMGVDTSTTVNQIAVPITPTPPSLSGNKVFWIKANTTNTGATTVVILYANGSAAFSPLPLKRRDGNDPQAGDIASGAWFAATCDGAQFRLTGITKSEIAALIAAAGGGGGSGSVFANVLFTATKNSAQSLSASTLTDVSWSSPASGAPPAFASAFDGTTLTIGTAGRYMIQARGEFYTTFSGGGYAETNIHVYRNGTSLLQGQFVGNGQTTGQFYSLCVANEIAIDLGVGDQLKVRAIASAQGFTSGQLLGTASGIDPTELMTQWKILRLS